MSDSLSNWKRNFLSLSSKESPRYRPWLRVAIIIYSMGVSSSSLSLHMIAPILLCLLAICASDLIRNGQVIVAIVKALVMSSREVLSIAAVCIGLARKKPLDVAKYRWRSLNIEVIDVDEKNLGVGKI